MDPAGIREVYLIRPYLDNPYQLERIARALAFKARVHPVYSINPWLPFSEPLTQRVSRASEGYAGWLQYDCAVLAGVDLESASERDVQHLRSALERGLPVLACGGGFGLGRSYRLWRDLEAALPAHIPAAEPVKCKAEVRASGRHPLLRGLPESFGTVAALHPVEVHADAEVLLAAGGMPVLMASQRHGGRQLVLAVAEAPGLCCDALDAGGFYGHPFYPDLMRRCLTWLMGVETPLWFESLHLETGTRMDGPGEHVFHVVARQAGAQAGAALRCSVFAVDDARMTSGGDTQRAEKLSEEARPLTAAEQRETFSVSDVHGGRSSGVYEVELALEMDDPPRTPPPQSFGMASPPHWTNWKGKAVDVRRFYLRFPDRRRTHLAVPGRTFTLQEGRPWRVRASAPDLVSACLAVRDAEGNIVGEASGSSSPAVELIWQAPALVLGDYTATLSVRRSGDVREEFRFALKAVALPGPDDDFHLVTHGASGRLSDAELLDVIRANLDEFGLDTLSLAMLRLAETVLDESTRWAERPFDDRRARWMDALAPAEGRLLWNDFDAPLIVLATHGYTKEHAPTIPCVHHPDYEKAARAQIEPRLRLLAERAGLVSAEIIDEPHLTPSNLCRCELCQRMYRERFGEDLPEYSAVEGDRGARRWRLFQWLEDYTTRAFSMTQKIKREIAPSLHLHNVAVDRLFSSNFMFNGMHRWAAHGDELYMACYPWSYLNWRGWKQMPHSQTHWIAGWLRGLARHYGIPWGVFMELWEHDVPNRWLPPYWSVCQFYSLLAEGADRLDTFLVAFGTEVFGISFERLREFGREVNKIRPFFPLLSRTARPRARMAFVNPWAEWVLNPQPHCLPPDHEGYGYYRRRAVPFDRLYPSENRRMLAYELFHRVFGDLDQVDEQLLCEAPMDYGAIIVCDCTFLMRRTMEKLAAFVEAGGVLILDCAPSRDETGGPADFFESLTHTAPRRTGTVVPGLHYRLFGFGRGKVLTFSASLQTTYADVVEGERAGTRARMEGTVAGLLDALGLRSRCLSSCGDVDAGLRLREDLCLIAVANTSPARQAARIATTDLPFEPAFLVNLTGGEFVPFEGGRDAASFDVALDGYRGALYALYPSRPARCDLSVGPPDVQRGQEIEFNVLLTDEVGRPARGAFMVKLTVTDGQGRAHAQLGGPHVVTGGQLRVRKRLPVNAPAGRWRVRAEEPIVGLTAEAQFAVLAG